MRTIQVRGAGAVGLGVVAGALLAFLAVAGARGGTADPFPGTRVNDAATRIPAVSTAIHDPSHVVVASVSAGTVVHAAVMVAGGKGNPTPTGSIAVRFFTNGTCTGSPAGLWGGTLNAAGALDVLASAKSVTTVGTATYGYRAQYLGDAIYAAADSPCQPLSVTRARPVIATKVHDADHKVVTSVELDAAVHAFVSVTGAAGTPTGTVTVNAYLDGTCTVGTLEPHSATLVNGSIDVTSFPVSFSTGSNDGSVLSQDYGFRVTYGGDAHYAAAVGPCEKYTVVKHKATITSAVHDPTHATVTVVKTGTFVHDSTVISGTAQFQPGGTATSEYFPNGTCAGTATWQASVTLSGGTSGATGDITALAVTSATPRTGSFRIRYSGNNRYQAASGPCEPITWKAPVSLSEVIHDPAHVAEGFQAVGTPLHMRVEVGGLFGGPTGSVVYQMWANPTCSLRAAGQSPSLPLVVGSGTSISDDATHSLTPLAVATFSFKAQYLGNGTYLPATGSCVQVVVQKAIVSIATTVRDTSGKAVSSVPAGSTVHDSIVVIGLAGTPTGTVRVDIFQTSSCAGSALATAVTSLSGGTIETAAAIELFVPGSYSYRAFYNGDAIYLASFAACEPFAVLPSAATPPPTATPGPAPTATPVATGTAAPGTTVGPAPSGTPGASAGPSGSLAPRASEAPGGTAQAPVSSGASSAPEGSSVPGSSAGAEPGATNATGESVGPGATLGGADSLTAGSPAGADVLPAVIVGLLVVVLSVGGLGRARSRRRASRR